MSETQTARPSWIRQAGLISVALPEPPFLQKFAGSQRVDIEEYYQEYLGDAALESLARAGVTLVWIRGFGGCGLEYEKHEAARVREFCGRAHAQGLKVGAVVALGSVVLETLLLEEPDAQNWLQIDPDGRPIPCGEESWRLRACYNSEAYLRYMERVCSLATEIGADLVQLDGVGYEPEPASCRCPVCVAAFRDFLRQQYGATDERSRNNGRARFGFNDFSHMRPPLLLEHRRAAEIWQVDAPREQEWIRFKVHSLKQCLARLTTGILKRNPQCAVGADLFRSLGDNSEWLAGISYAEHVPLVDLISVKARQPHAAESDVVMVMEVRPRHWREAADSPWPTGLLRTSCDEREEADKHEYALRLRALRIGRAANVPVEVSCDRDLETDLGVNLAFGGCGLGFLGQSLSSWFKPGWEAQVESDAPLKALRAYVGFFREHKSLLLGATTLSSLAIWCDGPSLAFNNFETHLPQNVLEQNLLGAGIPYELLQSNQLGELSKFRAVILPNCECLSDEVARVLEGYVQNGGGLIVIGNTGRRDQWRRLRTAGALAPLMGPEYPESFRRDFGAGRVAYLPGLQQGLEDLSATVAYAAGAELPWTVRAESGELLSQACRAATGETMLHLVNLAQEPATQVACAIACAQMPVEVRPLVPGETVEPLAFQYDNGRLLLTLPQLRRYAAVRVSFPPSQPA